MFRSPISYELSYVVVTQDSEYIHSLWRDGVEAVEAIDRGAERNLDTTRRLTIPHFHTVDRGRVRNLDTALRATNTMTLTVIEDRGWLFVNSEFVGELDVSGSYIDGQLSIVSGVFYDTKVLGLSTKFSDVSAQEFGILSEPHSGDLVKNSAFIAGYSAGVDVSVGYARASFEVDRDVINWRVGITFRQRGGEDYLVFYVDDSRYWRVVRATVSSDGWETLTDGYSDLVDRHHPIENELEVFFIDTSAMVYVNGEKLGTASIGSVMGSGDLRVAYAVSTSSDDHALGRFKDFAVWGSPHYN